MKKYLDKFALVGALVALVFLGSGSAVLALQTNPNSNAAASSNSYHATLASGNSAASTSNSSNSYNSNNANASTNAHKQANLAGNMLRVCEQRQTNINNLMNRITLRVNNQIVLFGQIASNVQNFYTKSGKTVSNYSSLVSLINAAQLKAQSGLSTLQQNSSINCGTGNPKAIITSFRGYVKVEIGNLENYRIAVKNLIVAVAKANNVAITNQTNSGN